VNRELLLEASIAITVGLLIAVLAAYRSTKAPKPGVLRRGSMAALLVYAVIAVGLLVGDGMTLIGLLVLIALMALPLVAGLRSEEPASPVARLTAGAVGVGLAAAMLIAAGQTLALLARVDPRTVVVVIVAIAALVVAGQGLVAAGRIGSTAMWFLIVPIAISLLLGMFVGAPGQIVAPIIEVPGLDWWQVLGLAVAFLALGAADNGLGAMRRAGRWNPVRVWGGAAVVVVLVAVGQLSFLGGAVISPSLQFFVFPANIDIVPGLAGVLLAILTLLFTALVVSSLSGASELTGAPRGLAVAALVAAVIALFNPGLDTVVVVTSLIGAALLGARAGNGSVDRGVKAGVIAVAVATLGLFLLDASGFGLASAAAAVVVAAVGFAVARAGHEAAVDESVVR
jgi:hypothetical protein